MIGISCTTTLTSLTSITIKGRTNATLSTMVPPPPSFSSPPTRTNLPLHHLLSFARRMRGQSPLLNCSFLRTSIWRCFSRSAYRTFPLPLCDHCRRDPLPLPSQFCIAAPSCAEDIKRHIKNIQSPRNGVLTFIADISLYSGQQNTE